MTGMPRRRIESICVQIATKQSFGGVVQVVGGHTKAHLPSLILLLGVCSVLYGKSSVTRTNLDNLDRPPALT
jgi:hypothetical protein